jgi:hypothetical protein
MTTVAIDEETHAPPRSRLDAKLSRAPGKVGMGIFAVAAR